MTEYLLNDPTRPVGLLPVGPAVYPAGSNVIQVGANKQYKTVGAAVAAAHDGDVVLVDAGTYTNDFVTVSAKLTIIGVGGMVNMVATVPPPNLKAIMTVDNDLTLQNFSFSGAAIPAAPGGNAAGIRYEAGRMVLSNDAFIGNQNGVMGGEGAQGFAHEIIIDHSLFSGNGSGSGNTHNIYIGAVDSLTVTNSIFEGAVVGHEFKSRALANTVTNNLFRDGPTGTASYDIDLPNGGVDVVTNNVIEKGPLAQNNAMVHFGGEGMAYADSSLVLSGNTFINDKNASVTGLLNQSGIPVTIANNTFVNIVAAMITKGPATVTGNVDGKGVALASSTNTDPVPGSTTTFTDTVAHSVVLTQAMAAVRGGAGRLTVQAQDGHVVAIGGAGGMDFTAATGTGGDQITTAAGSVNNLVLGGGDIVDSRGTDTIKAGTWDITGKISGTAMIEEATSYDRWTVSGTATIHGNGAGGPFVTITSGGKVAITGALDSPNIINNGGTLTLDMIQSGKFKHAGDHLSMSITGGSTQVSIWDGTISITTAAGPTGALIRLGDGTSQVTSLGRDVIWGGAGSSTVILSGQGEVHAGTGNMAIFARSIPAGTQSSVYGNGGNYVIDGNGGNITYYGGDKTSTVQAHLSNITMIGGTAKLTIQGGYSERIVGGTGGLDYDGLSIGSATITTAAGSVNTLKLGGNANVDSWGTDTISGGNGNDVITVHGNAVINGGTGNRKITLMGNDTLNSAGNDGVTVTQGADVTINVGKSAYVSEVGATVHVNMPGAKAATAVVTGGSASISANTAVGLAVTTNAKFSTDVALGTGPATVTTYGADVVHGGSGAATINVTSANTQVIGGSGNLTIFNGGGTLSGMQFVAGSGDANLKLYAGSSDFVMGSGKTTLLVYGAGANTFEFIGGKGGGTDLITGFRAGTDRLVLQGVSVQSQSVSGGSANLVLTDGTHVQLAGVTNLAKVFA